MKQQEFDDFKLCRMCKKELTIQELENVKLSHMPALCREHIDYAKKQMEKCLPLFSKMKF